MCPTGCWSSSSICITNSNVLLSKTFCDASLRDKSSQRCWSNNLGQNDSVRLHLKGWQSEWYHAIVLFFLFKVIFSTLLTLSFRAFLIREVSREFVCKWQPWKQFVPRWKHALDEYTDCKVQYLFFFCLCQHNFVSNYGIFFFTYVHKMA